MEFVKSLDYEAAVSEIKSQMTPYYLENGLSWDDESKLQSYKECSLWKIRDGEDVGFLMLRENNYEIYLAELHIAAQHRNKGYGSKALNKIREYAANLGYEELRIRVFKSNPAFKLYLRAGYIQEMELPFSYQLVTKTYDRK